VGYAPRKGTRQAVVSPGRDAYAAATVARSKTRQVNRITITATTKPTQYGAVIPYARARPAPSTAPTQLPPATRRIVALETRPSLAGGAIRCRREGAPLVESAPCTPKATNAPPTAAGLGVGARTRCIAASMINPPRPVRVGVPWAMIGSPPGAPATLP